jgi:hypothetical protein
VRTGKLAQCRRDALKAQIRYTFDPLNGGR